MKKLLILFFILSSLLAVTIFYNYKDRIYNKLESYYLQFQISQIQKNQELNTFKAFGINSKQKISHEFDNFKFDTDFYITNAWGDKGFEPEQFIQPYGTMLYDNFLFISDCRKGKIMIFDTETNELVSSIGYGWGQDDGFLDYPADISLNKLNVNDNHFEFDKIFVVEEKTHRISVFDINSGEFLMSYGDFGQGDGQFNNPLGIEVDYDNNVWVVDYGNNRLQKFDQDFNHLLTIGSQGNGIYQFDEPYYMTIDEDNNIYIVDRGNNRVSVYDSLGNFQFNFGEQGSKDGQFNYPHEIVYKGGRIFIADYNNHRIQIFDKSGNFIGKFGNSTLLSGPKTVSVSDIGEIYVTDLFATFKYVTKWENLKEKAINPYDFYANSSQYYFPKNINEINGYPFIENSNYEMLEYTPEYPFYSNYTVKKRMVFVPNGKEIDLDKNIFPEKTVIQKDFYQNTDNKLIERRFMIYDDERWNYASYTFNDKFLEINLSPSNEIVYDSLYGKFDYYVPGLNNCYDCHKNDSNETLGFRKENLVYDPQYSKSSIINLSRNLDLIPNNELVGNFKANCAYCHNDVTVFALDGSDLESKIYKMSPVSMDTLIIPGDKNKSKIYSSIKNKHMPPYGISFEDHALLDILGEYIDNLPQNEN